MTEEPEDLPVVSAPVIHLTDQNRPFYLEEYKSIRAEIIERMKLDQLIQRNANLSIAGLFALYFAADGRNYNAFVLIFPVLIAYYALFQQSRFKMWAARLGAYSMQIEAAFAALQSSAPLGWENFVNRERIRELSEKARPGMLRSTFKLMRTGKTATSSTQLESTYWSLMMTCCFAVFLYEATASFFPGIRAWRPSIPTGLF